MAVSPGPDNLAYNGNNSHLAATILNLRLSELPKGVMATVRAVEPTSAADAIARRLMELGFVAGEAVRVLAAGPVGAEPLLIQIGYTRFALRRAEAARVKVEITRP